ncbi:SSI family serine proteinase inhibitor [Arthrobacter sp. SX1312]|uniref:SSI family serine proteinase inhibitor n=1 Tax=Arthrobacter sp. SX1312 TaxID=2058896 RepID=UPI000CE3E46A|nr:SSI family serine proteinase inhibitor [Arthrobacter sp. SX1312]
MTSTDPRPAAGRARRAARRALVPLVALTLALSACSESGPPDEPDEQETAVQSPTPSPAPDDSATPGPAPSGAPSAPPASAPPASATPPAASTNALLTISVRQDASSDPVQYVLECVDGVPGPASTHPNADAACATLTRIGAAFFTARPNKDVLCTQQYAGPQTASITGEIDGTPVVGSFALTDGCEISRWNSLTDLLGAPGAQ